MIDAFATFQIHYGTEKRSIQTKTYTKQDIEIPSSWYGVKPGNGSYRLETRSVIVVGTIEVSHYDRRRVEYGKCRFQGHVVLVVKESTNWKAIDRKPISECLA